MNEIRRIILKHRSDMISALTIALTFIAILCIYFALEVRVHSNDECLWVPTKIKSDSSEVKFNKVKVSGVSWNAGIRNGDYLVGINGQKIKNTIQAQLILDEVKSGDFADYEVRKPDGKILNTKVYVKKLVQFGYLAQSISALFWILIAFIVYTAKPGGLAQKLFYSLGVFIVLSSTAVLFPLGLYFQIFITERPLVAFIAVTILIVSKVLAPLIMLYFIWTFPKPFEFARRESVKVIFISVAVISSLIGIGLAVSLHYSDFKTFPVFQKYTKILGYVFNSVYIAAWVSLIVQYFKEKNKESKKPILILVIAFSLGIAIQFYSNTIAPAIADIVFNSPGYYMPIILMVLIPLIFAYAILKYNLLDVSIVVRNTIIYGAAMATVALIYFAVSYLLGQGISQALGSENQGIVAGVFFLVFAFVFQSTKDRFQDFLTRRFYPEQSAYQKVLIQFSNDVSTVVGGEKILDLTTQTFIDALKINKFGILLHDYKKDSMYLARAIGFNNPDCIIEKSNIFPIVREKLLVTKYPVIEQEDFEITFPGKSQRLIEEEIYSVFPIIVKAKVVGALLFGLKHSGSRFGGKDLELLTAAANQIAVSLENARLYLSESEKIKIERDLDLARKIQQSLLPKCIPNISGLDICGEMISAMQVGGDYYDLIQISDTKLFVAVGDVSGKGLSASLYMTKLQTMIQIVCKNTLSPKEILIEVNKRLYESMERSWFITMTLALFDTEKRTVKLCRAGHMPLLIATNGTVESVKTKGIGLGLEKGQIFDKTLVEEEIKIKSGQIFAFFSDGITEAMNENLDLFSESNLIDILKDKPGYHSSEIMKQVWKEIEIFKGPAEPNDDMTIVIVKAQ
ncbi:MAG: SpoIIE family protein phosphatase [Ignavibacteriaceae bacterium]